MSLTSSNPALTNSNQSYQVFFNSWDFCGPDPNLLKYSHKFFMTEGALYLLVFSLLDHQSAIDYWVESVTNSLPQASIIVVGTHSDDKKCTKSFIADWCSQLERKCHRFSAIKGYCAVSCVTRKNIDQLRKHLLLNAMKQKLFGVPIPQQYLALTDQMRAIRQVQTLPIISKLQYQRLATRCGVKDH